MQVIAIPKYYMPGDYERIPFTTGAVIALTASKVISSAGKPAQAVLITVEGATARWKDNGADPTTGASGEGSPFADGEKMTLNGVKSVLQSRWIGLSASGAIHAHYYY